MLFPVSVPLFLSTSAIAVAALGSKQVHLQQPLEDETSHFFKIPALGFGTSGLDKAIVSEVVSSALHVGFRHLDCASVYGNQREVGRGISHGLKSLNLNRSDIWITSKLWNDQYTCSSPRPSLRADPSSHDPSLVEDALTHTLHDLGLAYLDLWLMHWPVGNAPETGKTQLDYLKTWHAMEKIHKAGRVRNIGISNFSPAQLKDIIDHSDTKPFVHQFEVHPYLPQTKWIEYQQKLGISVTAYAPLANTNPHYHPKNNPPFLLTNPDMLSVAAKVKCSTVQVALAWGISRGYSVIPKSSHIGHIKENFEALECHLQEEDLKRIDKISEKYLKRFINPSKAYGIKLFDGLEDA
ncbi:MAG: hypothetical protein Q9182_005048 [Xanthomendoza sp. 2 TL-2023]